MTRRVARLCSVLVLPALLLLLAAPPLAADEPGWQMLSFNADITVEPDGTLQVTETMIVDFVEPRRGIFRQIPYRVPLADDAVRYHRFEDFRPTTAHELHLSEDGDFHVIAFEVPEGSVTGQHVFAMRYRVHGALSSGDELDLLWWNVTGDRWDVPIERASARVIAPVISDVGCFHGPPTEVTGCDSASHDGSEALYSTSPLLPGERLAVTATFPSGAVHVPPPEPEPGGSVVVVDHYDWEILSFDADYTVQPDGTVLVTETIAVDFRDLPSRGIFREIPFRVPVDDGMVRRYRFTDITVSASPGARDDLHLSREGHYEIMRIGDPDTFITGPHTYEISYRLRGALNAFEDHDELFWNITGDRWEVPIRTTSATIRAPAISDVACFHGATGEDAPCDSASHDGTVATFATGTLSPQQQLDVVIAFPSGAVRVPEPELEPDNLFARVFAAGPLQATGATAFSLLGLVGAVVLARRGRDEQPALADGTPVGGVEFRPPDGLRPAQLRTLVDQRVDDVQVSATVVDLAVRGHLQIAEVPGSDEAGKEDWVLHRSWNPQDHLEPYEQEILRGLFGETTLDEPPPERSTPPTKLVSDLGDGKFRTTYEGVVTALYRDVVDRGYFHGSPRAARGAYQALGALALFAGFGLLITVLAVDLPWGLVVLPLPVIGVVVLVLARHAPRRTAAGAAMNLRAKGFREFIRTAEADRMDFAESEQIFATYLPYAMVFDCVDRWVQIFEQLGVQVAETSRRWYTGRHGQFGADRLTRSMSTFSSSVGGTMRQTASSSGSSGFSGGGSGGGGGGGGGGRW